MVDNAGHRLPEIALAGLLLEVGRVDDQGFFMAEKGYPAAG
jgi:hypothetical protein